MLTEKMKAWAVAYVRCGNATQAAQEAGYAGSFESLKVIGCENKDKPEIQAYMRDSIECIAARQAMAEVEKDRIADIEEVMEFYTSVMCGKTQDRDNQAALSDRIRCANSLERVHLLAKKNNEDEVDTIVVRERYGVPNGNEN